VNIFEQLDEGFTHQFFRLFLPVHITEAYFHGIPVQSLVQVALAVPVIAAATGNKTYYVRYLAGQNIQGYSDQVLKLLLFCRYAVRREKVARKMYD
jgi:hypothetical protein